MTTNIDYKAAYFGALAVTLGQFDRQYDRAIEYFEEHEYELTGDFEEDIDNLVLTAPFQGM